MLPLFLGKIMNKWQDAHMKVAEVYANLSTAVRLKVGCVIVKDKRIISIGYNGMPSGWDNKCENEIKWPTGDVRFTETKPEVLHAETNAIAKLARSSESGEYAELYCTHAPCLDCAKLIYQSGIEMVYYKHPYKKDDGLSFLRMSGVGVIRLED